MIMPEQKPGKLRASHHSALAYIWQNDVNSGIGERLRADIHHSGDADGPAFVDELVRRYNAHDELIAALMAYRKAVGMGIDADPELWADAARKTDAAFAEEAAAIAKAEG